jgi:5'-nucleotidase
MYTRRKFIQNLSLGLAGAGFSTLPFDVFASGNLIQLTILHTNDVHSRIDPFPKNDPLFPGMGGFARRAALIKKIRSESKNVLLLDAGDILQGTPYFNFYQGEIEMQLMSKMEYDAATIGNHDFDGGLDRLSELFQYMNFPFINLNYNFTDTILHNKVLPYKIFKNESLKTGVFGLGIELIGLVDQKLYGNTRYENPVKHATEISNILKYDNKCDLVICLSHLGYKYSYNKISDEILAKECANIDLIIGGHTHTFLEKPVRYMNKIGKEVLVAQTGWGGVRLGRIDFFFNTNGKKKEILSSTVKICENTIAS